MLADPIIEIVTIGREILDGRVVDTNSVRIAEALRPLGLIPRFGQRVDDHITRIVEAFEIASARSDLILITGGLGPTSDDITAEAFAKFLGETLSINSEAAAQVEAVLQRLGVKVTDQQKKQALLPPSCFVFANPVGTAPGFGLKRTIRDREQTWYFFPGVPREMIPMLDSILPRLPRKENYRTTTWATHFTAEAELQCRLTEVEKALPKHFEISYRTRFPENFIALYAECKSQEEEEAYKTAVAEIDKAMGSDAYAKSEMSAGVPSLEEVVLTQLRSLKAKLITVESCTGGMIADRITSIAGASDVLWGSLMVYDNRAKETLAYVSDLLLSQHGAVSRQVAKALAEGGLMRLRGGLAGNPPLFSIATTGIAGPGGGSEEKPVGLCFIALARTDQETIVEEIRGRAVYERARNRALFTQKALDLVRRSSQSSRIG